MEGEGCCGCESAAMTIQTGVERDDILFLSTDNEVNYLTVCLYCAECVSEEANNSGLILILHEGMYNFPPNSDPLHHMFKLYLVTALYTVDGDILGSTNASLACM